jgi:hypothetical protein
MSYLKTPPILPMEGGPERELMACFFRKLKHIKGLTTALDQIAGVNGKWLKPDEPHNIPSKRLLRIVLHTMHFLGREECKRRTILAIDYVFDHILPVYVDHLASKRKQRPPSIRRLYWRRYWPSSNILITHQIIKPIKTFIYYAQPRTTLYPAF